MRIDFATLSANRVYHTLIQCVVPRPIAWVLTDSGYQRYNLAPFSYFTPVCSDPPLLMLSVGRKPDGSPKDTAYNAQQSGELVIHIPAFAQAAAVTESSRSLPHGESELDRLSLALAEWPGRLLPRLADCPVAFYCSLHEVQTLGAAPQTLLFARVEEAWLADEIAGQEDGRLRVDIAAMDPLARLGGEGYAGLGTCIEIARPA